MHDIRAIREDPAAFDRDMIRRGLAGQGRGQSLIGRDEQRRAALSAEQKYLTERNERSKEIGMLRRQGGDTSEFQARAADLNAHIANAASVAADFERELKIELDVLPNRLDASVPDGADEDSNREVGSYGNKRSFDFPAKQHFELGETLGLMDFDSAARIAGARFTILRGPLARLERALGQFMLDLHTTEHGYQEVAVPGLINDAALYGTGQLPKFAEDCFRTTDNRWLIPTAEVPLTNIVAGKILAAADLPRRMAALTDCYRSEAGSAGRDTRGMLRQHQFRKVEMVSIVAADASEAEHERMTRCAETVLERLELPYRRMLLCAGDTGFSAAKTYDLEVWLPGQNAWREISSCSNCRDFQARRMNARVRAPDGRTIGHVHTLNGSGVAVGRALIAVMENYQLQDGGIAVPELLQPYLAGIRRIGPGAGGAG